MPRNSSGVYTLPAGNPVVPGTTIDAAWANTTLEDLANEVTNSLSRTGAGGMLAPFRVADGTVTAPGVAFLNETNTGFYRVGAGSVSFSILGVNTLQMNTTAVTVPSTRTLNAQGNAIVGGTFGVTGAATFASTLAVTGALTATGGVTGNVTAASGTSTFNDVVINGALDMVAGSSATITGLSTPTNASDAANKGYVDTAVANRLALAGGTMSGAIAMGSNKITGLGTPTADQDAATKAYVDGVAQGLDIKASCRAATTANITLSGAQTIDGVAVIAGDRVLVKNQSSAADNGIYVAAAGAWSRAADANTWDELVGAFTFIEDGTTNDNSGWVCAVAPGGALGVTAVTFEQFSGAGQVIAGTGMTKTGNTLNVNTASASRIVVGADEIDLAATGVSAGTYRSVTVDQWGRVTSGTNPTTLAGYGISDAYTTTQTDSLLGGKLNTTGGTLSGALAMSTNRITGVGDPVNAQDAATKNYIDTIFGSTSSAAASAAAAAASASSASSSASSASSSASSASSSASTASTALFNFRAQYLGPLASDPTVDGNGNPVTAGDLYFNTAANEVRVYNGSAWVAAYLPAAGYMDLTTNQTAAGVKTFSSNPILSSGAANGVAYLNTSKAVTSGSNLVFDGSKLGVLASSPYSTLDVGTTGANVVTSLFTTGISDLNFRIGFMNGVSGSTGTSQGKVGLFYLGTGEAASIDFVRGGGATDASIAFRTLATERMRLDEAGRLGIGTTAPVAKLDVVGDYREGVVTANTGTAYTISTATGTLQILTLTGNCTFTFPTAVAGESFTLLLKQDGTGSRTVTWPAAVKWPGGTAPTITSTASKLDKYIFTSDGTNWYGSDAGKNYTV